MKPLVLSLFFVSLLSHDSHARWATLADAESTIELQRLDYEVDRDGTYEAQIESISEILREGGRSQSTLHFNYNSRATQVKLKVAETINGDKIFTVDSNLIEDKPLASNLHGFDELNMLSVAFPKVNIGSKIHYKILERHREVPVPGHFSARFEVGSHWYTKSFEFHLKSEMPLFLEVNDPGKKLTFEQKKISDHEYITVVKSIAPIYSQVIDEQNPWVSRNKKTWFVLSSSKTYGEIADKLAEKYERVLNSELPASFSKIAENAAKADSTIGKLNTVTSELANEVRYMGDWRPVAGGHVPRSLQTIAETKFGDCKDFSAVTAAVLRKLGLKAHVAWVERGIQPTPLPELGLASGFNHAIVFVSDSKRDYWIDPTNFASFAQGIFEDIAGRNALIVESQTSRLAAIPESAPRESIRTDVGRYHLSASGDAVVDTRIEFKGIVASHFTGALLQRSKEHIDHLILSKLVDESRLRWHEIDDYDLRSRVTRDFEIHASYEEKNFSTRTTVGPAFRLDQRGAERLIRLETQKRVSDVFLGHPHREESSDTLENITLVGRKPKGCHLKSPWFTADRELTQTHRGLKIYAAFDTRKPMITNEELKSDEFQEFQHELQKCFDRIEIVYRTIRNAPRKLSSD